MATKKQLEYNKRYDAKNMKSYTVKMKIELYNEMKNHIDKLDTNQNAFTIQAVKEKLERDSNNVQ